MLTSVHEKKQSKNSFKKIHCHCYLAVTIFKLPEKLSSSFYVNTI